MIAAANVAHEIVSPLPPRLPAPETASAARDLALAYLRYASASWRGEPIARLFETRLSAFWRPELPPEPAASPAAVSPHGGGGRGIRWYVMRSEICGYIPGSRGGFRVPVAVAPRLLRCVPSGPRAARLLGP